MDEDPETQRVRITYPWQCWEPVAKLDPLAPDVYIGASRHAASEKRET